MIQRSPKDKQSEKHSESLEAMEQMREVSLALGLGGLLAENLNVDEKVKGGLKYDVGKSRLDLLPCSALMAMGEVMAFGAKKYDAHNWRKGLAWSRCAAAALRHIFQWLGGETNDRESGLNHLAHAGVNICFLLEYAQSKPELDDRYAIENDGTTQWYQHGDKNKVHKDGICPEVLPKTKC